MKSFQLLSLVAKRPCEFWQRATPIANARIESYCLKPPAYSPVDFKDLLSAMEKSLRISFQSILNELELKEIEAEIREGIQRIPSNAPVTLRHNADFVLGRLCYVLAR